MLNGAVLRVESTTVTLTSRSAAPLPDRPVSQIILKHCRQNNSAV